MYTHTISITFQCSSIFACKCSYFRKNVQQVGSILFQTNFIITQLVMFYLLLRFDHHRRPSSEESRRWWSKHRSKYDIASCVIMKCVWENVHTVTKHVVFFVFSTWNKTKFIIFIKFYHLSFKHQRLHETRDREKERQMHKRVADLTTQVSTLEKRVGLFKRENQTLVSGVCLHGKCSIA